MALPRPTPTTTALVTGASSGLGVHFATELAELGHHVTVVARREAPLRALAEQIAKNGAPVPIEVVVADLATQAGRAAVLERIAASGRSVSVLINKCRLFNHWASE